MRGLLLGISAVIASLESIKDVWVINVLSNRAGECVFLPDSLSLPSPQLPPALVWFVQAAGVSHRPQDLGGATSPSQALESCCHQ